jgi:hypothetical protein
MATFDAIGENLFGRSLRLFVAHWILSQNGRQFFQMELISASGRHSTDSLKPLKQLIAIGMVEELPSHVPGQRRKYYRQKESPLWDSVAIAVRTAGRNPQAEPRIGVDSVKEVRRQIGPRKLEAESR